MNKTIHFTFLLFILASCSNYDTIDIPPEEDIPATSNIQSLMIDTKSQKINSAEAKNLACIFRGRNCKLTSRSIYSSNELTSIKTIYGENSEPLLYIVNWGNNEGFVIISATKNTSPILAYSEEGYFDINNNGAAHDFLESYKLMTSKAIKDNSDTLRLRHALEWALYENNGFKRSNSRASSTEIESMIQNEIAIMTSRGYQYIGKISEAAKYLPADEFYAMSMDVKTHSDPKYNYEDVCLFFLKSTEIEIYNPIIGTKWTQNALPFNEIPRNGIAGCVTIALGQIAYYYKYPQKYNWDAMPKGKTNISNQSVNQLIGDILNYASPKYNNNSTSISFDNACNVMKKFGYSVSENIPSFDGLRDQIEARKPVFIAGYNPDGNGHAWVCEGYQRRRWSGVISMIGNEHAIFSDPTYDPSISPYMHYGFSPRPPHDIETGTPEYCYYMNFGWGGKSDGWYNYNSFGGYNSDANYTKNQKVMYITRP